VSLQKLRNLNEIPNFLTKLLPTTAGLTVMADGTDAQSTPVLDLSAAAQLVVWLSTGIFTSGHSAAFFVSGCMLC